jgi:hypothetical protein
MRVGIYAYGPTTLQLGCEAKLYSLSPETKERTSRPLGEGAHELARGIYLVYPTGKGSVSAGGGCDVIVVEGDKDDWPDPKGQIAAFDAAFPTVDHNTLKEFVSIVRGLSTVTEESASA